MTTPQSPDLDPYAGLSLDPRSAQDFIDEALDDISTKMPGFVPQAGFTEVVLIEALALLVGEMVSRVNFIPVTTAEIMIGTVFGVPRSLGTPATASVRVDMIDTIDRILPAGTRVGVIIANTPFTFTTIDDLHVATGAGSGTVAIQADEATAQLNGIASGTTMQVIDSVSFVERVTLVTNISGGSPEEDDSDYLDRGAQVLRRLTDTLVTPDHFIAAALTDPTIRRATAVDLYDGSLAPHAPGGDPGHISVACLDLSGNPLVQAKKDALQAVLAAQCLANLAVHVIDPTTTAVPVSVTVVVTHGSAPATVEANITAALTTYLSPLTWPWSGTVRYNELIALISNVDGVDYVSSMSIPFAGATTADMPLPGAAPLATVGPLHVIASVS